MPAKNSTAVTMVVQLRPGCPATDIPHQIRGAAQAHQGHDHAGQADHAQRPGRECSQAVQGQAEQPQPAETAIAVQALVRRVRQGFAP